MVSDSSTDLESWPTVDDDELYVDFDDGTRGTNAPFYAVYRQPDRNGRYGWLCSDCGSVKTVMDPMGTIECAQCENRRKPTHWDAVYL